MSEIFDAMSRAMLGAIALTKLNATRQPTTVEAAHLDPSELALMGAFEQWLPFVDRTPRPKVVVMDRNESNGTTLSVTIEPDPVEALSDDKKDAAGLQALVAVNLRAVHDNLGRLIERWDAAQVADHGTA